MSPRPGIDIQVAARYGDTELCHISDRAQAQCPFLDSLEHGSSLPDTPADYFKIILRYLDGQDTDFEPMQFTTNALLLFAQTWALAAKMNLPAIQNKLVDRFKSLYSHACRVRDSPPVHYATQARPNYNPDMFVAEAFKVLNKECGNDSRAERFLICWVARFALDVTQLEHRLNSLAGYITGTIRKKILHDAKELSADPIKYDIERFMVKRSDRHNYTPLTVVSPPEAFNEAQSEVDRRKGRHWQNTASTIHPSENASSPGCSQRSKSKGPRSEFKSSRRSSRSSHWSPPNHRRMSSGSYIRSGNHPASAFDYGGDMVTYPNIEQSDIGPVRVYPPSSSYRRHRHGVIMTKYSDIQRLCVPGKSFFL